jgi:hypothetical protein
MEEDPTLMAGSGKGEQGDGGGRSTLFNADRQKSIRGEIRFVRPFLIVVRGEHPIARAIVVKQTDFVKIPIDLFSITWIITNESARRDIVDDNRVAWVEISHIDFFNAIHIEPNTPATPDGNEMMPLLIHDIGSAVVVEFYL